MSSAATGFCTMPRNVPLPRRREGWDIWKLEQNLL